MRLMTPGGPRICDPNEVVEARGVADVIPVITRVAFGPHETIWVTRTKRNDDLMPVDVFTLDGEYVGTFDGPAPHVTRVMGDNRIAAIETDELDVDRLTIYRVSKGRDE